MQRIEVFEKGILPFDSVRQTVRNDSSYCLLPTNLQCGSSGLPSRSSRRAGAIRGGLRP